ncbi:MAG: hypothetical protein EZS28_042032, partial [Streblomastix strix]
DSDQYSGIIEDQWTIGIILNEGPTAQQFSICQSLDFSNASRGLRISTDGNTLTFNCNGLFDAGTDQTIAGTKTFVRVMQIQPNSNNFYERVRISRSTVGNYGGIYLGCNPNLTYGALTDQSSMVNTPTGELRIGVSDQLLNYNQRLMKSAVGNTLNFYRSVNSGKIQINPTATGYNDDLRISRSDPTSTGNSSIQLGCSRTSNVDVIEGQWSIFTPPSSSTNNPQSLIIAVASQAGDNI